MTFLPDPLMSDQEVTLVNAAGCMTHYTSGAMKASDDENARINGMLDSVLKDLDYCLVVRRTNGELAVTVDLDYLYEGSEELQGSYEENQDALDDFYFDHQPGPFDYSKSSVEAFVENRYARVKEKLDQMDGAEMRFYTNSSYVEARIYLSESACQSADTLKLVKSAVLDF